jgi:hypothetical protein
MNCNICSKEYNNSNNKPFILFPCCHTFCSECVLSLTVCRNCSSSIDDKKANLALFDLLDEGLRVRKENNKKLNKFETDLQLLEFNLTTLKESSDSKSEKIEKLIIANTNDKVDLLLRKQNEVIDDLSKKESHINTVLNQLANDTNQLRIKYNELKLNSLNNPLLKMNDEFKIIELILESKLNESKELNINFEFKQDDYMLNYDKNLVGHLETPALIVSLEILEANEQLESTISLSNTSSTNSLAAKQTETNNDIEMLADKPEELINSSVMEKQSEHSLVNNSENIEQNATSLENKIAKNDSDSANSSIIITSSNELNETNTGNPFIESVMKSNNNNMASRTQRFQITSTVVRVNSKKLNNLTNAMNGSFNSNHNNLKKANEHLHKRTSLNLTYNDSFQMNNKPSLMQVTENELQSSSMQLAENEQNLDNNSFQINQPSSMKSPENETHLDDNSFQINQPLSMLLPENEQNLANNSSNLAKPQFPSILTVDSSLYNEQMPFDTNSYENELKNDNLNDLSLLDSKSLVFYQLSSTIQAPKHDMTIQLENIKEETRSPVISLYGGSSLNASPIKEDDHKKYLFNFETNILDDSFKKKFKRKTKVVNRKQIK